MKKFKADFEPFSPVKSPKPKQKCHSSSYRRNLLKIKEVSKE